MFNKKYSTFQKYYSKDVNNRGTSKKKLSLLTISNALFVFGILIFFYFIALPSLVSMSYKSSSLNFTKPFEGTVLSYVYKGVDDGFTFNELSSNENPVKIERNIKYNQFLLGIPSLGIKDARVDIDSVSLDPSHALGHYSGTALPGEVGNSFVYGHSSLPFFYNVNDYKTIFTKLPELEKGDKIIINMGTKEYIYKVKIKKELLPKEVDPFSTYYPSLYNKATLTLMTCTPPGSKKYRYIVLSELQ